jgi:hypothetical protein
MKRLGLLAGIALIVALATNVASGQPATRTRTVRLWFTTNHGEHGQFPAVCLGTPIYQTIPSRRGDHIRWIILNGNGSGTNEDVCEPMTGMDKAQVSLHFKESPFEGTTLGMPTDLTPTIATSGVAIIEAVIDMAATRNRYRYTVQYRMRDAGPDPDVEVDCTTCG